MLINWTRSYPTRLLIACDELLTPLFPGSLPGGHGNWWNSHSSAVCCKSTVFILPLRSFSGLPPGGLQWNSGPLHTCHYNRNDRFHTVRPPDKGTFLIHRLQFASPIVVCRPAVKPFQRRWVTWVKTAPDVFFLQAVLRNRPPALRCTFSKICKGIMWTRKKMEQRRSQTSCMQTVLSNNFALFLFLLNKQAAGDGSRYFLFVHICCLN